MARPEGRARLSSGCLADQACVSREVGDAGQRCCVVASVGDAISDYERLDRGARRDLRRTIALIPRPMLVIAGRDDTVTAAEHGERIATAIPGARLVVLPTEHLSNVERPTEFLQAVLDFLQAQDAIAAEAR